MAKDKPKKLFGLHESKRVDKRKIPRRKDMPDKELKELALALREGTVFGDWMIPEHDKHLVTSIFMPLLFMNNEKLDEMKKGKVTHLYEYTRLAGPRSINGYPIFMSFRTLTKSESTKLGKMMKKIEKALEGI